MVDAAILSSLAFSSIVLLQSKFDNIYSFLFLRLAFPNSFRFSSIGKALYMGFIRYLRFPAFLNDSVELSSFMTFRAVLQILVIDKSVDTSYLCWYIQYNVHASSSTLISGFIFLNTIAW